MNGSRIWFISLAMTGVKNLLQDKLQHISINVTLVKYLDRGTVAVVVVTTRLTSSPSCQNRAVFGGNGVNVCSLLSMQLIRVCIIKHVILLSLLTREMGCHLSQHLPTLLPGWCRRWHARQHNASAHQLPEQQIPSPSSKNSNVFHRNPERKYAIMRMCICSLLMLWVTRTQEVTLTKCTCRQWATWR